MAKSAKDINYDFKILKSVMDVNHQQKTKLITKIKEHFKNEVKGKTIAIWGLAFKPYTDDIREAPALYNIEELLDLGVKVKAHDPEAMENVRSIMGDKVELYDNQYDVLDGADALLIITEWPVFRQPEFDIIEKKLKNKVIFDGRNLYKVDEMSKMGYAYYSIGRKETHV